MFEPAQQCAAAGEHGKAADHGQAGAPGKKGAAPPGRYQGAHPAAPLGLYEIDAGVVYHRQADQPGHAVVGAQQCQQGHARHRGGLHRDAGDDGVTAAEIGA